MATEWDDIQRRIGNRPNEIYVEEETLNKFILEEVESKGDVRQYSSVNELNEMLEESVDDEDERILLEYRKKRVAEMKAQLEGVQFGRTVEISKSSFIEEVSNASQEVTVVCLIYKRGFVSFLMLIRPFYSQIGNKQQTLMIRGGVDNNK